MVLIIVGCKNRLVVLKTNILYSYWKFVYRQPVKIENVSKVVKAVNLIKNKYLNSPFYKRSQRQTLRNEVRKAKMLQQFWAKISLTFHGY